MKPRRRSLGALLALLLGLAAPAAAQESAFSLRFLGVSEETGDARARSIGVLGVALDDPRTAITLNPASLGSLTYMTISGFGILGRRTATAESSVTRNLARLPHQRMALPVFGKAVLSLGYIGLRNFDSAFRLPPKQVDIFQYEQRFERQGTLFFVPVGVSTAFGSRLRAGVTLDFLFGTVDESWQSSGDSLVSLRTRRRDAMSGRTATLGIIAYPLSSLRLGASFEPAFTADRSTRTTIDDPHVPGTTPIRDSSSRADVRFPASLRGGAALELGRRWLLSSDYLWRDWKPYDGRLYGAEGVREETRLGGGVEWRPGAASGFGHLTYRAGLSRYTWPQIVGGHSLRETALHLGTGFDFTGSVGRMDVGFEYAWIGDRARNGLQERSWRVVVGLSGQELWKRKSPR